MEDLANLEPVVSGGVGGEIVFAPTELAPGGFHFTPVHPFPGAGKAGLGDQRRPRVELVGGNEPGVGRIDGQFWGRRGHWFKRRSRLVIGHPP